jgi:hypothetical protein
MSVVLSNLVVALLKASFQTHQSEYLAKTMAVFCTTVMCEAASVVSRFCTANYGHTMWVTITDQLWMLIRLQLSFCHV